MWKGKRKLTNLNRFLLDQLIKSANSKKKKITKYKQQEHEI